MFEYIGLNKTFYYQHSFYFLKTYFNVATRKILNDIYGLHYISTEQYYSR